MSSFELLHPMIRAVIPATIPTFTMTDAIREAARMFCIRTVLAQEKFVIYTDIGVDTYRLRVFNEDVTNVIVLGATVDDKPYTGKYSCPNTQSITLFPVPTDEEEIVLDIAVKPTLGAKCLEYGIVEEYAETLRDGALSILYNQAGSEWFEPNAASVYKMRFESSMTDIIIRKNDGFTNVGTIATGENW